MARGNSALFNSYSILNILRTSYCLVLWKPMETTKQARAVDFYLTPTRSGGEVSGGGHKHLRVVTAEQHSGKNT